MSMHVWYGSDHWKEDDMYRRTVTARACATALAVALGATLMGACGASGQTKPATGNSNTSTSPELTAALSDYQKFTQTQPAPQVQTLPMRPPSDRTITIQTCPLPVCKTTSDAAREAALKLGWKVTYLQSDLTPQAYQAVLTQIVQSPPQLLALTPLVPNSFIATQLAALKRLGTKIVEIAPAGDTPTAGGPVEGVVAGPPDFSNRGTLMGDSVAADARGSADTLFVWDPVLTAIWTPLKDALTKAVTATGGKVAVLAVKQENIGKTIPAQVTSYLQSHPNVKYVAFVIADLAIGVPAALKSAGLPPIKIISTGPQASTMADIAAGDQWASVGQENASAGYRAIDQLVRLTMTIPLGSLANTPGWAQIFIKENVTNTTAPPAPKEFPQNYLTAWKIGQ